MMLRRLWPVLAVVCALATAAPAAAQVFVPNDPGIAAVPGGWTQLQWNFLAGTGVDAPLAWEHLAAAGRPGGSGVVVAVLDTGVAYRNWRSYRRSPDFAGTKFVAPYDFVAHDRFPLDRNGHGTLVAAEIAEATNNQLGLTGLAYGATIMPIRVAAADGTARETTVAEGIRWAVAHGAQVINLSLGYPEDVTARMIPQLISAIREAVRRRVLVVAASGNDGSDRLAEPARDSLTLSVGATTRDGCLAAYSNWGRGLDLVAPGGGNDAAIAGDVRCNPYLQLPSIYQYTLLGPPATFGIADAQVGTSFAAPEVSAAAALVIASGNLGRRPTPQRIQQRLEATATDLGRPGRDLRYGNGLLNAGRATAPR